MPQEFKNRDVLEYTGENRYVLKHSQPHTVVSSHDHHRYVLDGPTTGRRVFSNVTSASGWRALNPNDPVVKELQWVINSDRQRATITPKGKSAPKLIIGNGKERRLMGGSTANAFVLSTMFLKAYELERELGWVTDE